MTLLPCPFCGSEADYGCDDNGADYTECRACRAQVYGPVADWNRRSLSVEDATFAARYINALSHHDMRSVAGILSGRLRQMDKRAAAANARADALAAELKALRA